MDTLQFIGGDSRSIRAFRRVCANSDEPTPGGRDSGLLGVRPVVPFMSFEDLNRPSYQYLLVEVQCAKTTTLILWASVLALTVVVSWSYWIDLGLAVFAGPMQAAVAFSSPVAFVSNRERDNSSDRAILLGDSPCERSAR